MSAGIFEIVVRGTLSPAFVAAFEGFTATVPSATLRDSFHPGHATPGTTQLVGWVPDQAKLHGALEMLRDLGVELVSVTQLSLPTEGRPAAPRSKEES